MVILFIAICMPVLEKASGGKFLVFLVKSICKEFGERKSSRLDGSC